MRTSARTRSWEKAEINARTMEDIADPNKPAIKARVTILDAIECFRDDERSRHLSKHTQKKSEFFLENQLKAWAAGQGFVFLDQLTPPELTRFRSQWGNGSATTRRKHERLVAFFWFCVRMDWIEKNPALLLKRVKVDSKPTDYFTRQEFDQLVDATYAYGNWLGGHDYEHRRDRIRALILLMRWSGLAIKDAVTLERPRIDEDGNLFLYRAKTGVPVYVPLPPFVHALLASLPNPNPRYFFWSGSGDPETCKRCWTRALARLFRVAQMKRPDGSVKRCHSHMLRDTFAVELLLSGVPIDQVSLLLGHSSVKVTERHYAPFVKARQEQLAQSARKAWHFEKPKEMICKTPIRLG
ncbi:MAG: tyrosine-type recombinase/integrase [Acidobacteriia bacterium]|nr:tyrosine-type recombinase/integrase [Terriglobia bacterium]